MSLIQRLTTIRTLLMNICDAWTAAGAGSRSCASKRPALPGWAALRWCLRGPVAHPADASISSRRAPEPMWKLATAPDSLNRSTWVRSTARGARKADHLGLVGEREAPHPLSRRRFISLIVKSMSHTAGSPGNRRLCDSAWTSTKKSLYIVRMAERSSMSSMAKMWFDANPMPFGTGSGPRPDGVEQAEARLDVPCRPVDHVERLRDMRAEDLLPPGLDGVAADAGPQLTIEVPRGDPVHRLLHRHAVLQAAGADRATRKGAR